jgi:hypothetical protein
MKTREEIITSMCYTWRHDYGIRKDAEDVSRFPFTAGVTKEDAVALWNSMAQIFDNDIAPHMKFKKSFVDKHIDKLINQVRWERGSSEDFIGLYNTISEFPIVNEDYGQFTGGIVSKTYHVGLFEYQCVWWDEDKYPNEIVRTRIEDAD